MLLAQFMNSKDLSVNIFWNVTKILDPSFLASTPSRVNLQFFAILTHLHSLKVRTGLSLTAVVPYFFKYFFGVAKEKFLETYS